MTEACVLPTMLEVMMGTPDPQERLEDLEQEEDDASKEVMPPLPPQTEAGSLESSWQDLISM